MDSHDLCRGRLKLARIDAKKAKVNLPYVCSSKLAPDHYAVFANMEGVEYSEYSSCCAFDARAEHIYKIIDKEEA